MKRITTFLLLSILLLLGTSSYAQTTTNLDATSFASKIKQASNAQIIDVRTPGEYSQGHIEHSQNMNVASEDFEVQIKKLNKTAPVFLYCLSGSRSAYAMRTLAGWGFKEIYNLSGGMMRWRAANLPETTEKTAASPNKQEMTLIQFQQLLNTTKPVLVVFYADWCSPCQQMKPHLEEIAKEMKDKVIVARMDADANKTLAKQLNVKSIPALYLYKNKKVVWSKFSYTSKAELQKEINKL